MLHVHYSNSIRGIVNYSNSQENLPNSTIREYYSNSAIRGEYCLHSLYRWPSRFVPRVPAELPERLASNLFTICCHCYSFFSLWTISCQFFHLTQIDSFIYANNQSFEMYINDSAIWYIVDIDFRSEVQDGLHFWDSALASSVSAIWSILTQVLHSLAEKIANLVNTHAIALRCASLTASPIVESNGCPVWLSFAGTLSLSRAFCSASGKVATWRKYT
jgi:hypothetical protein